MKPIVRPSESSGYGTALGRLERDLLPTLRRLDEYAADPGLPGATEEELAGLQYRLHTAAERVLGLEPWPELADAHADLHVALSSARDETAGLIEALAEPRDEAHASALVWEWRVALFGVRLALRRLDGHHAPPPVPDERRPSLLPVLLLLVGVAAVLGGALADLWPVWSVGLAVVGVSAGLSHRVP